MSYLQHQGLLTYVLILLQIVLCGLEYQEYPSQHRSLVLGTQHTFELCCFYEDYSVGNFRPSQVDNNTKICYVSLAQVIYNLFKLQPISYSYKNQ
jgi:hypothetical protein